MFHCLSNPNVVLVVCVGATRNFGAIFYNSCLAVLSIGSQNVCLYESDVM